MSSSASRGPRRVLACCVVAVIALASEAAGRQATPPAGTQPDSLPVFRSKTRLIVQTVSVKDDDGKPIEGLTADDFVVEEDGERQTISFVEFQRIDETPESQADVAAAAPPAPAARNEGPVAPALDAIAAPAPGDARYRDRRLLVLYFDLASMPAPDKLRAYTASRTFIATHMHARDVVAVMGFDGAGVRVKQYFTADRARLQASVRSLVFGDDEDGDGVPDAPEEGTAFGQDDVEFNILNLDRQLSALQAAVTMLQPLPEQKVLVYFSSGLRPNGTNNQAQLRATVNAAIRSNVALYPIDARGLVAQAPLGDATKPSPGGQRVFSGQLAEAAIGGFRRSQDTLHALAQDTGGKAMLDSNDLSLGIRQAAESLTSYYIVAFYSTHAASDGRFHRVRVTLAGGVKGEVSHRDGYFADKAFAQFTEADREHQLKEALMLENPVTDLTIAMEVNYFQLNRAEYFVPVSVKIPGSELATAKRRGAARTVIDFIAEVKDEYGFTQSNMRDRVDIKLSDETAAQLATTPVRFETGFTLLPGNYVIKFLARDSETGRIGTYQTPFTIPNLDKEDERRVAISSVVLGSQRAAFADALHNVQKARDANEAANPLVSDGQKLIPSVTRAFRKSRDLHVFLEAYQRDANALEPLVAFVTLYRGEVRTFQSDPLAIARPPQGRSKAVPLRLRVPLADLAAGPYDCQVTVLDPTRQRATFWRAPIAVIP